MAGSDFNATELPDIINLDNSRGLPGLITRETKMLINDILVCGFQPVVTVTGLLGNSVSLTVLLYLGFRDVTNIILIGLTTADLLYVLSWYGPIAECVVRRFDPVQAFNMEMEYKSLPIMISSNLGKTSRVFTCLIAVERYIAVIHPLAAPSLLTRKRILVAAVVLAVLSVSLPFHVYLLFDLKEAFNPHLNATVKTIIRSKFNTENHKFMILYNDVAMAIVFSYVPIILVTFCTGAILLALRKSQLHRAQMTAGRDDHKAAEQRQVTKTLVTICIVFIVCTVPEVITQVARLLFVGDGFNDVGRYRNISFVVVTLSLLFSLINSSVNFFFYVAYSRKFQAAAKRIFLCKRKTDRSKSWRDVTGSNVGSATTEISVTNLS